MANIFMDSLGFQQGTGVLAPVKPFCSGVRRVRGSGLGWGSGPTVPFSLPPRVWHFPLTHHSSRIFFPLTHVDLALERAARLLPFKLEALFRMSALIYFSPEVIIQTQPELKCGP